MRQQFCTNFCWFVYHHLIPDINFNRQCLIKHNISIPWKVINLYISDTLNTQLGNLGWDFTLGNSLFGSVKLTKICLIIKITNHIWW